MIRKLFQSFVQITLGNIVLLFVKNIKGAESIPQKGPFIVVANHASYIDPAISKALFDRKRGIVIYYLAKKEVFNNIFMKFFFESAGTIPVDREKKGKIALDCAISELKKGNVIGLFPEGTRTIDGKLHKGKTGAARLALSSRCPILPIGFVNSYELWPRTKMLPRFKRAIIVNIGKPFTLEKYYKRKITKKLLDEATDEIMLKIRELSGQDYVKD